MGIGSIAAIFGPPLAGWTFDTLGSYRLLWLGYIGLIMVAIVLVSNIKPLET
jgi:cyanate permease